MNFPSLLRSQLLNNQSKLYYNNLRLVSESTSVSIVNGTPESTVVSTTHWEGKGSLQYVRPRIQKSMADEYQGTMEDPVSVVCYLPYDALPDESMVLVDLDGVLGAPNQTYVQSRKPANVGGVNVYWELYLGLAVND
jgi:hypothetical protein